METACYKCAAPVDQGVPFCKECRAPQIRVIVPEPPEPVPPPPMPSPEMILADRVTLQASAAISKKINWAIGIRAAAIAGLSSAILVVLLQGGIGIAMLTSGLFAVMLYVRRNPHQRMGTGMGFLLGMASGSVLFAIIVIYAVGHMFYFGVAGVRASMAENVKKAAEMNPNPEALGQAMQILQNPLGFAILLIFGMAVLFVISIALSGLGGAIGGAFARRRTNQ